MGRADISKRDSCVYGQGLGKLSGKGQSINDLGFAGPAGNASARLSQDLELPNDPSKNMLSECKPTNPEPMPRQFFMALTLCPSH